MSKVLFATEIVLCRLDGCVPQQELDLLQLSTTVVTQLCAGSPQIMRGNVLQSGFLAAGSDHVPDDVLRDTIAPNLSQSGDRSKDFAITDPGGACPLVESRLDPHWDGHRANVATLADQIDYGPMALTHLDVIEL